MIMVMPFSGCTRGWKDYEYQEGDFSLEITVDKTEAAVGDVVEITATFKNLSGRDLPVSFMDPVNSRDKKKINKEYLLIIALHPEWQMTWFFMAIWVTPSRIALKKDEVISRTQ